MSTTESGIAEPRKMDLAHELLAIDHRADGARGASAKKVKSTIPSSSETGNSFWSETFTNCVKTT